MFNSIFDLSAFGAAADIPAGGAVVTDGQAVTIAGPDGGTSFGTYPAKVQNGTLQQINLSAGRTVITDQAGFITVSDADGTQASATAVIVSGSGALSYVSLPSTSALVSNNMACQMANFGGAGAVPGIVNMTGGYLNWVSLASQTNAIIADTFSTSISAIAVSPSTDFATVNVSSGALQSVGVSLAPTKTVITNGVAMQVPVTGTYTNTITPTIANGVVTGFVLS